MVFRIQTDRIEFHLKFFILDLIDFIEPTQSSSNHRQAFRHHLDTTALFGRHTVLIALMKNIWKVLFFLGG